MKKKMLIVLCILVVLLLGGVVWWKIPVRFLRRVDPGEVAYITVFDGNSGKGFTIDDPEEIAYVVENIQSCTLEKDSIAYRMGYRFRLTFIDENEKEIDSFIMNGSSMIRKGLVYYYSADAGLCSDYLYELEEAATK